MNEAKLCGHPKSVFKSGYKWDKGKHRASSSSGMLYMIGQIQSQVKNDS